MFIAQVMYAEGLAKVLKAILRQQKSGAAAQMSESRGFIQKLEQAEAILAEVCPRMSLAAVKEQLAWERGNLKELMAMHGADISLLERCGIKQGEYQEKFRLISADCLRISHSSVKPPEWAAA